MKVRDFKDIYFKIKETQGSPNFCESFFMGYIKSFLSRVEQQRQKRKVNKSTPLNPKSWLCYRGYNQVEMQDVMDHKGIELKVS